MELRLPCQVSDADDNISYICIYIVKHFIHGGFPSMVPRCFWSTPSPVPLNFLITGVRNRFNSRLLYLGDANRPQKAPRKCKT